MSLVVLKGVGNKSSNKEEITFENIGANTGYPADRNLLRQDLLGTDFRRIGGEKPVSPGSTNLYFNFQ